MQGRASWTVVRVGESDGEDRRGTGGEVERTRGRLHTNEKGQDLFEEKHTALSQFRKRFSYLHNGTFFCSGTLYVCKNACWGILISVKFAGIVK